MPESELPTPAGGSQSQTPLSRAWDDSGDFPKLVISMVVFLLLAGVAAVVLFSMIDSVPTQQPPQPPPEQSPEAGVLWGLSGFSPRNNPRYDLVDAADFWSEVGANANIFGVTAQWDDRRAVSAADSFLPTELVVTIEFQTPELWTERGEDLGRGIGQMLSAYPQIRYVVIGRDLDSVYRQNKEGFSEFVDAYSGIYSALKPNFPNVVFSAGFTYESLRGRARILDETLGETWEAFAMLEPEMDFVSLSVFPFLDIAKPELMPADYFGELRRHTQKPLVITETGWISQERFGVPDAVEEVSSFSAFSGSEEDQVQYLDWLSDSTGRAGIEAVLWLNLCDPRDWREGELQQTGYSLIDSVGLRYNDGRRKLALEKWLALTSRRP